MRPKTVMSPAMSPCSGPGIALAWIFIYHGAYTLFGAFGGSGLHSTSIYFATVAHLHPGGFFAVVAGVTELVGGAAVGVGIFGRIAAVGLVVVMVMAMVTVTFSNGISAVRPGRRLRAQSGAGRPRPCRRHSWDRALLARRRAPNVRVEAFGAQGRGLGAGPSGRSS